jgi:hypothetical protein
VPDGTATVSDVALAEVTVALTAPKSTILSAGVAPNELPLMVTVVPTGPDVGEKEFIMGCACSKKGKNTEVRKKTKCLPLPKNGFLPGFSFGMGY